MANPTRGDLEKDGCVVVDRVDGYKNVTTPDGVTHQVQDYGHVPGYNPDTAKVAKKD